MTKNQNQKTCPVVPTMWYFVLNLIFLFLCSIKDSSAFGVLQRRHPVSETSLSWSHLQAIKESTFGMGCFWDPSEEMLKVNGVLDTVAGYTGNPGVSNNDNNKKKKAPTYESVCYSSDWVEGVRITYDDDIISYEQLLDEFFEKQKPQLGSRQYASIIFPHDEDQMMVATKWKGDNTGRQRTDGFRVDWTTVEPKSTFYQAEGYHQRYWQKQRPRFGLILFLLAVATGLLNPILPLEYQDTVESLANGATLTVCLYITAERFVVSKVVEL